MHDDVRQARAGDRAAWRRLHDRYAPVVHAVLLTRVDPVQADDLVQDTFLIALDKLEQLRDDAAFGGWLCAIARSQAHQHHRRTRSWSPLSAVTSWVWPTPSVEAREALDAIRALPEAYQELMLMRLVEGMTGPEIAEALGRTPGSVRVSLHRGMAMLRDALGEGP
jgi:RNA polymerase sigma-70 factor (ECF subfamily)